MLILKNLVISILHNYVSNYNHITKFNMKKQKNEIQKFCHLYNRFINQQGCYNLPILTLTLISMTLVPM